MFRPSATATIAAVFVAAGIVLLLLCAPVYKTLLPPIVHAQTLAQSPDIQGPFVGTRAEPAVSLAVRTLPPIQPNMHSIQRTMHPAQRLLPMQSHIPTVQTERLQDALRQPLPIQLSQSPSPFLSFEGISFQSGGNGMPADPVGDVGPHHYVQMVNTAFAIYDKEGHLLSGPIAVNKLWDGVDDAAHVGCKNSLDGDVIVLYDEMADRWVLSQFAKPQGRSSPPWYECIAVSTSPDPEGTYYLYSFEMERFPDYPKLAVWPGAYFMVTNEIPLGIHAFDRTSMLAGEEAIYHRYTVDRNFILPADFDGATPPPSGAPGYFYTMMDDVYWPKYGFDGTDRLEIYTFDIDFTNAANTSFVLAQEIETTPFNYLVCTNAFGDPVMDCIPQRDTDQKLDVIAEWPMWRLQYRNFGTHETLVGNFTVEVDGGSAEHAGIRWFELRKDGSHAWSLHQEGTHAPDANHRWVGSIAMNGKGDLALGYSVSGPTMYPSIRYATRQANDPLGTLRQETTLIDGTASQTDFNRWGDYSAMNVDPSNDCTFWYTNEYLINSDVRWQTRIGAFHHATCVAYADVAVTPSHTAQSIEPGNILVYPLQVTNQGNVEDTFSIGVDSTWNVILPETTVGPLAPGNSQALDVMVYVPSNAAGRESDYATLTVTSTLDATVFDTATLESRAKAPYDVDLTPAKTTIERAPGSTFIHTLSITNTGYQDATYTIIMDGATWPTTLLVDADPDIVYAPGDKAMFTLQAGMRATAYVHVTIPTYAANGMSDTVTINVTPNTDATFYDTATLTTRVGSASETYAIAMTPVNITRFSTPNTTITSTLHVTNTGAVSETFAITIGSDRWVSEFVLHTAPSMVFDAATTLALDVGEHQIVSVITHIPPDAAVGMSHNTLITVTSQSDRQVAAHASLETLIQAPDIDIAAPHVAAFDALSKNGYAGTVVHYTLTITNTSASIQAFVIEVVDRIWSTTVTCADAAMRLNAGDVSECLVAVSLPPTTHAGDMDTATVTVALETYPTLPATFELTTIAQTRAVYLPLIVR